ncbi:MAG: type II secretion system F family protein [Candidatus Omnitrophica bacterium]|nr:type II secretion system F family protein [Candidatus Omnitrophota bacterium]MDD5236183.1 type II secretion system F family protein [Candidatus Omnitrophota bacterium]MDD5610830.1 type II secretion system F family protein [Candidatus Omnitrophota bacterium]
MLIAIFIVVFVLSFLIANRYYAVAEKRLTVAHEKKVERAAKDLNNLFVSVQRKKILFYFFATPVVLGVTGFIVTGNPAIAAIFAFIGLSIPQFVIKSYDIQRRKKFSLQLIDALMLLSASLKAGLSLNQAFEELVEEMPAPISQEFDLLIKEINMGVSFDEALLHLKKRMRSEDLDLIVTAIAIARETGGQLPTVFSKLVFTIKERQTLRGKVGALTVQAKLQGIIMSILPVIFVVVVYKFNPEHFQMFLKENIGRMLLIYAVISQIIGTFLIIKFSQVEI